MRISMIGVGLMGHGIAANLLKKGHELSFLEHPGNQPTADLMSQGALAMPTIESLAATADMVLVVVTGSPQVEQVVRGPGGLLAHMRPGLVVIDCSTAIPDSTVALAQAVEAAGGAFADAAMTRTPKEAAEGRLNLLVGAPPALFERIRPVLACFAENITHAGPVGAGHRLKLLHNFVSLGSVTLMAEAFACAEQSGIPAELLVDTLAKGGGWGAALDRIKPYVLEGKAEHFRFSVANASKDLTYYNGMAQASGVSSAVAQGVLSDLQAVVQAGQAEAYMPLLASLLGVGKPRKA